MEKLFFYSFDQNNSGGYFVEDETHGVCELIIVQAKNSNEAINKLYEIGSKVDGFDSYCPCCGERWSTWLSDDDGTETPSWYGKPIEEEKASIFRKRCFVHYSDGSFKEHKFNEA